MIGMDETTPVDPELAALVEAMQAEAVARGVVDDGERAERAKATQRTEPARLKHGRSVGPAAGPVARDWLRRWEDDHDL